MLSLRVERARMRQVEQGTGMCPLSKVEGALRSWRT